MPTMSRIVTCGSPVAAAAGLALEAMGKREQDEPGEHVCVYVSYWVCATAPCRSPGGTRDSWIPFDPNRLGGPHRTDDMYVCSWTLSSPPPFPPEMQCVCSARLLAPAKRFLRGRASAHAFAARVYHPLLRHLLRHHGSFREVFARVCESQGKAPPPAVRITCTGARGKRT